MKLQLHNCMTDGISLSLHTVLYIAGNCSGGPTKDLPIYCQLVQDINKQKRLEWTLQHQNGNFENVIFSDEASILINCSATVKRGTASYPLKQHRQNTVML